MPPLDPPNSARTLNRSSRADLRPRESSGPANLADILERVLDKGIVIAGDIQINLLDIELLTIKLRLLICSVDRAQEMGINWWESDDSLSTPKVGNGKRNAGQLQQENRDLRARIERLERLLEPAATSTGDEHGDSEQR